MCWVHWQGTTETSNCNDMEHYNKYYLVMASEFDNQRAKPPPTIYGEQRRHDIEQSYKDLLREVADPSARVFHVAAEFRKKGSVSTD